MYASRRFKEALFVVRAQQRQIVKVVLFLFDHRHDVILLAHHLRANQRVDLSGNRRIFLQELAGILAALRDALITVGEPRAGLVDDVALHGHVQQGASLLMPSP